MSKSIDLAVVGAASEQQICESINNATTRNGAIVPDVLRMNLCLDTLFRDRSSRCIHRPFLPLYDYAETSDYITGQGGKRGRRRALLWRYCANLRFLVTKKR